jgi:PAS domain S-box-containing protein
MEQHRDDATAAKGMRPPGLSASGEALLHSPNLLQAVLENTPAGVAVADSTGKIILANSAIQEIIGEPLTGTAFCPEGGYLLLNPDGSPIPPGELPLPRALQKGEPSRGMEILVKRSNGGEALIKASASPIRDGTGAVAGVITVFQDITEQQLIKKALRENREQLGLAQKAGHLGLFDWDPVTNTGNLSAEMKSYFGLPPEYPITLEHWGKVTPPEDIKGILSTLEKAAAGHRKEAEGEYRVFRPDGEVRWISARGMIYYNASGKPVHIIGTTVDITDLKKAQEALRTLNEELERKVAEGIGNLEQSARSLKNQKELLQAIIDSIPVIVTVWRTPRQLLMVNREFERLSGWSREEATSMDIIAASFPDPAYRKEIIRLVAKAEPGWGEFVWTTRSGKVLTISWAAVDLSDGSRVGIGIDITERRKMEMDVLRLATAIDQAGEGIVLFSSEWVIEYVNPAYERLSGYSREELIGKGVDFLNMDNSSGFQPETPCQAATRGAVWSGHTRRKKRSGEVIDIHLTVSPVRGGAGEISNYVSVVQDVTQELRLQQMVIQSQKMEAIGSLAGGIAHDLKNIFTPILINSEIALEDVGMDNPAHPLLQEILNASRVGVDLVKQIMTFARRTPERKIPVDVSTLVNETLSLLRSTIPSTIDIHPRFKARHPEVLADPTQIKQVLMNLGSNAAYAMKEHGGLLEVDVTCVDLDRDTASKISPDLASGSYVEIDVSDTGEGMDEETQQHIFDPFFTTKGYGEGTGLGLAVVRGIVKGHQGAVSVWSRPGRGAAFKVLLPKLEKGCPEGSHSQ